MMSIVEDYTTPDGRQIGPGERPDDHAFSQPFSTAQTAKA